MKLNHYRPPRCTDKELLEIFPEAKGLIPKKIREWQEEAGRIEKNIQNLLKSFHAMNLKEFDEWIAEEAIKIFLVPKLLECEKHIFRLKRLFDTANPSKKKSSRQDFQEKIEAARNYPIAELAQNYLELKRSGGRYIGLCPFHNEKTPSFFLYPETNTFHCFGCQEHGDIIKLTMALCGLEFKEAVLTLQN